jgi:hypothetical protein
LALSWGESIFRYIRKTNDLTSPFEEKEGKQHDIIANQLRKKVTMKKLEPISVEDMNMFPKAEHHPILFEEITLRELPKDQNDPDKTPKYEYDKVQDVIQGISKHVEPGRLI